MIFERREKLGVIINIVLKGAEMPLLKKEKKGRKIDGSHCHGHPLAEANVCVYILQNAQL